MNVLFLDCDGVMNNWQWACFREEREHFPKTGAKTFIEADVNWMTDKTCSWNMKNLQFILDELPELKVVISSSWRKHNDLKVFKEWFKHYGLDPERIIDMTPRNVKFRSDMSTRGLEIADWVEENKPKMFVVVDDHTIGSLDKEPHFFKTDQLNGLTFRDAVNIIAFLNPKWRPPVVLM